MVNISDCGPPISKTEIVSLEESFGAKLPDSYLRFLLLYNGGLPAPDVVDVENLPGGSTDIQEFMGIGLDIGTSNISWNLEHFQETYQGSRLLPIARDSGGNIFFLQEAKDGDWAVIYYDWTQSGSFYNAAPNFETFLKKIRKWEH
jgi:SMI1-KNR4 cell-wall